MKHHQSHRFQLVPQPGCASETTTTVLHNGAAADDVKARDFAIDPLLVVMQIEPPRQSASSNSQIFQDVFYGSMSPRTVGRKGLLRRALTRVIGAKQHRRPLSPLAGG